MTTLQSAVKLITVLFIAPFFKGTIMRDYLDALIFGLILALPFIFEILKGV